jgi:hypothetical protein
MSLIWNDIFLFLASASGHDAVHPANWQSKLTIVNRAETVIVVGGFLGVILTGLALGIRSNRYFQTAEPPALQK